MQIDILRVPYDSGHERQRMGRGPDRLIESGLPAHIETLGHRANIIDIRLEPGFTTEVAAAAELARRVSAAVRQATEAQHFPLVLSGNCNTSLGTVPGLGGGVGVIWFDAHGDFNTPETTPTGFFDGQALAALTGRCWSTLTATIPGFEPIDDSSIMLVGARDLDERERDLLSLSCVVRVDASLAILDTALRALATKVQGVYLHVDLDVLDRDEVTVNRYAAADGVKVDQLIGAVTRIGRAIPIRAAALTAYDPEYDPAGAVCAVAGRLVQTILTVARTT
jgi:arginase